MAIIELEQNNYAEAKRLLDQCLEIECKLGNQSKIADTTNRLGFVAELQNNIDLAEKLYQQAYKIFEKLGDKAHLEIVSENLERLRHKMSDS